MEVYILMNPIERALIHQRDGTSLWLKIEYEVWKEGDSPS